MSEEKLSSEKVPAKFAEWLLAMGCPPEDVPPLDKIQEMCRGEYYMVWRSVMEHVGPKDKIHNKRLQVFNNDIAKCRKKNVFNELDVNMPKELSLWRKQTELRKQVSDAEARLAEKRELFHQLRDKVSSKMAHRSLSRKRLQDSQRRLWLLQQESAELREMTDKLQETKSIATSLCGVDESPDVESKIDKYLSALSRPLPATATNSRAGVSLLSVANPGASSSIASTFSDNDAEEQISSLVKCRGETVFKQLFERRSRLCNMAAASADSESHDKNKRTLQSVLAETAALHCNLALEAVKNRIHTKQTRNRFAAALCELNGVLSGEACEHLVLRCENTLSAARVQSLRSLYAEVQQREGVFETTVEESDGRSATLQTLDKAILSKRDELKQLIVSAAAVERKTKNVKDSLVAIFNSLNDNKRIEASELSNAKPQDSIASTEQRKHRNTSMRQFYEEKREKRQKIELSMNLDVSEGCSYELTENASPKFSDELGYYLKKFSLEKNRKLVLKSGEKIWIFETVESALNSLYSKWQNTDITTSVMCPSVGIANNLTRLSHEVARRNELMFLVRALEAERKHDLAIDITATIEEERTALDKIKKRLNDNILNLRKTDKTLTLCKENINLWSENGVSLYISDQRKVQGRTYKEFERALLRGEFVSLEM